MKIIKPQKFGNFTRKKVMSGRCARWLNYHGYAIVKKNDIDKVNNVPIHLFLNSLVERITNVFLAYLNVNAIYEKMKKFHGEGIDEAIKHAQEDIVTMIENFLETLFEYEPKSKSRWKEKVEDNKKKRNKK